MSDKREDSTKLKIRRNWSIELSNDITVRTSDDVHDAIAFLDFDAEEPDQILFTLSWEQFDALHKLVKEERERVATFEALELKQEEKKK